jgi:hypothetical protein
MGEAARIGSFSQDYVLRNFPETAIEDNKIRNVAKYDEEVFGYTATDEEYSILSSLGGAKDIIDMSTELAASAAILNIRSVEPQDALKIYTEIAMENAVNSFLGITGTTHAEVLSRLKAKYNFTDRQILGAIENAVRSEVDAQFNKVAFILDNTSIRKSYDAVLTRNAQNHYALSYERLDTIYTPISGTSPEDLLTKISKNSDFNQTSVDQVRAQAALIPAVRLGDKALDDIAVILEQFYTSPTLGAYSYLKDVYVLYENTWVTSQNQLFMNAAGSYANALSNLNQSLAQKVFEDSRVSSRVTLSPVVQQELVKLVE